MLSIKQGRFFGPALFPDNPINDTNPTRAGHVSKKFCAF